MSALAVCMAFGLVACGGDHDGAPDGGGVDAPAAKGKADTLFKDGPMHLTGAFDGSKKFQMWVDTVDFARRIKRDFDMPLAFTYFINTCYFDTSVSGSWIGKAHSQAEVTVRWALMQQALNEGHEIGNHSVRHQDGGAWSESQWREEFQEWHDLVEANLFKPVYEPGKGAVFPDWQPMPGAAEGEVGAACATHDDCATGICLPVSDQASFCSATCNKNKPCGNGTVCGAPDWNQSKDLCVPMPAFPVEHDGEVLFDESGRPNLSHSALQPYQVIGFRAPQLAHNSALFEVLEEFGYRYDTSKILKPGPPKRIAHSGKVYDSMFEYALMKNRGSLTVPMDYNYKVNDGSYERMLRDYKQSIVDAYLLRDHQPWNIGHHFALWRGGGYWRAMKEAFVWAAQGCPSGRGETQCEDVAFTSFKDLTTVIESKADGVVDPFHDPLAEGEEHVHVDCPCGNESH